MYNLMDYVALPVCASLTCQSTSAGLSCLTPFGGIVICDNTNISTYATSLGMTNGLQCNCNGAATAPTTLTFENATYTLNTTAAPYAPLTCPSSTESGPCKSKTSIEICSFYMSILTASECIPVLAPTDSTTSTRYNDQGAPLTCDGQVHYSSLIFPGGSDYICSCPGPVSQSLANSIYQRGSISSNPVEPAILSCNAIKDADDVLVGVDSAFGLVVQSGGVDLRPIVNPVGS
jgi:hypothetical protein